MRARAAHIAVGVPVPHDLQRMLLRHIKPELLQRRPQLAGVEVAVAVGVKGVHQLDIAHLPGVQHARAAPSAAHESLRRRSRRKSDEGCAARGES
eukprot:1735903-Prymnesium_polylepis.1